MQSAQQKLAQGWNEAQVRDWHANVMAAGKTRDYGNIVSRITALPANTHIVETYGTLSQGHPLLRITIGNVKNGNPNILITSGVHGYEPSGIEASLYFAQHVAPRLTREFNFVIYPSISPWAYEYNQRWNAQGEDTNRLFTRTPPEDKSNTYRVLDIEECRHFMNAIESHGVHFDRGIDLHETSDMDIALRVDRANRFGSDLAPDYRHIPPGFYLIVSEMATAGHTAQQLLYAQSIVNEVAKVSPIAPDKKISGKSNLSGVIQLEQTEGMMRTYLSRHARLVAVTEVYPDHPNMGPEKSIEAQLAALHGAINHNRRMSPS